MSLVATLFKYYFTLKPLKFEQIYFRLKYRFFPVRKLSVSSSRSLETNQWFIETPVFQPQSFVDRHKVKFLNQEAQISTPNDWNSSKQEKLWLYNLHYFDDLNGVGHEARFELQKAFVHRWINENPPVMGNGWEPYPISLRLVNWIKWYQRHRLEDEVIVSSIYAQAIALKKQLEYHILGNHLFANAKALIFVGVFFKGATGEDFLNLGLKILKEQLKEQFLDDGGHFELSPMYHSILLWDLLDLINLAQSSKHEVLLEKVLDWKILASKALSYLVVMTHPDGEISFFNDAATGIAPSPETLFRYAEYLDLDWTARNKSKLITLKSSSYTRAEVGAFVLFFDHAEIGPSYLPAHGHADALSIEMSLGESRILVNSGTSVYGTGPERARQRSTNAHNTVEIDGQDSSEVWGGFRVARSAKIISFEASEEDDSVCIASSHNGYARLRRGLIHSRKCRLTATYLECEDTIKGSFDEAKVLYHLHPETHIQTLATNELLIEAKGGQQLIFKCSHPYKIEESTWHPEFGVTISNQRIVITTSDSIITSRFCLR